MSRAEFDTYTLTEFCDLVRLWRLREKRRALEVAKQCYVMAVSAGATLKGGEPIPVDFFSPDYKPKPPKRYKGPDLLKQFLACLPSNSVKDTRPNGKK